MDDFMRRSVAVAFCISAFITSSANASTDGVSAASAHLYTDRPFRIGIIELSDTQRFERLTQRTIPYLKNAFAPYVIDVKTLSSEDLENAVKNRTIDAFIASSGFYWRMIPFGARDVATMISADRPDPNHTSAITFLARRTDSHINTLEDMQGKRLSASYPTAFMGYRIGLAEIAAAGFDPDHFFSSTTFTHSPEIDSIAQKVLRGEADVAFVQSCWLEAQPKAVQNQFHVIGSIADETFPCRRSTETYPNLTAAVLQGTAPGAAREIARLLLNMPADTNGERWGLATDFQSVDRVYKLLKLEHYSYLREPTLKRWIATHMHWIAVVLFCLLLLVLHTFAVTYLVRKRTSELAQANREKEAGERRLAELNERMEKIRKASIVSQLSNMIAHELAQPVGAARSFSDGLKLLAEKNALTPAKLATCINGLDRSITRVQHIVEKVRNYNKGEVKRDTELFLSATIKTAVDSLSRLATEGIRIDYAIDPELKVLGDPLETELLFYNLLSNAAAASKESRVPLVTITATQDADNVKIAVENNGKILSEAELSQLAVPFISVSGAGHGLGIPISLALTEANGGHLAFERRNEGGLRAIVVLRRPLS